MKEKNIKVRLQSYSYEVVIKSGITRNCAKYLRSLSLGKKILLVTQNKIPDYILQSLKQLLKKEGFQVFILMLPSGEQYKNIGSLLRVVKFALKNKFGRNDSFCAVGGGVVSDLTGFAASIYFRGLNFICVPTTLLAMVDAAVGGKTGINLNEGKNLVGTFYQPRIVLIDPTALKTLPQKEFLIGMAEVIKYALIEKTAKTKFKTGGFFSYLKNKQKKILARNVKELLNIIYYSVLVKAKIVSKDEKESNIRAILNLGHTFGHGIEQAFGYKQFTHGEAVSIGMCMAASLACRKNLFNKKLVNLIYDLIGLYGLPTKLKAPANLKKILGAMLLDKKQKDGKLKFIVPAGKLGRVKIINNVSRGEIEEILAKSAH